MSDYIENIENAERRYQAPMMEVRESEDGEFIEGVAIVVNKEADLGWFREMVMPGAFDGLLDDDIVALFNHDNNLPLARTTAKLEEAKLHLYKTDGGDLGYRYKTPPTTIGRDLAYNIKSGIVPKSSFAFTTEKDEWKRSGNADVPDLRIIHRFKRLYDVSPVTRPAYNDTSVTMVAARSLERSMQPEKELAEDSASRDKDLRNLNIE